MTARESHDGGESGAGCCRVMRSTISHDDKSASCDYPHYAAYCRDVVEQSGRGIEPNRRHGEQCSMKNHPSKSLKHIIHVWAGKAHDEELNRALAKLAEAVG